MLRFVYAMLTYAATPILLLHLFWRSFNNPPYRQRIAERFGFIDDRIDRPSIWVHAVSVGEVMASATLVRALLERYPDRKLVLTTMTPTGSERVQELFGDKVVHSYVPYDLAAAVRRFFDRANPGLVIIVETELWPNLFRECGLRKIPLVIASARVSPRSVDRYKRVVGLFRETLSHGIVIAAQSQTDADRFIALGANPKRVRVTGNIKFDFRLPPDVRERGREFRDANASRRPVWVAASTHDGEEPFVLAAHARVLEEMPDTLLVLVPRHPERFQLVADLVDKAGLTCVRRSSDETCSADTQVFLGDSMGELMMFYAASDVAFVGGSLVPIGGHNLLEPAALGLPLLAGPNNFNAPDIAELLIAEGSTQVIHGADELAAHTVALLRNPEERALRGGAGRECVENNRGTLERVLELIEPLLAPASR
ncbi:MAG: lipid IV(A) 3-deoxy-D-manno-octulosonic acid transferase [Gammaproteobacteria bacterium]